MRLWKRASNALKDQSSLWQASLLRRSSKPEIHKAVIRATSHHDSSASDRRKVDHVREWLRLSPSNLKPILWSLSTRMEKSRSWAVALRGLLLTHALLNHPTSTTSTIGRLPFDLSSFADAHTAACPLDAFVRAYYAFLDQKSANMFHDSHCPSDAFLVLHRLQGLVDLLLQIRPPPPVAFAPLVLDVMDAVVAEIYDVYGRICRGIAVVLLNIYSAGKAEASAALRIVQKATRHGDELAYFFQFCQEIRVANAAEFPVIDRIPEEGIQELEHIIQGLTREESEFKTVITQEWERFDQDSVFPATCAQEPPDLITFF